MPQLEDITIRFPNGEARVSGMRVVIPGYEYVEAYLHHPIDSRGFEMNEWWTVSEKTTGCRLSPAELYRRPEDATVGAHMRLIKTIKDEAHWHRAIVRRKNGRP